MLMHNPAPNAAQAVKWVTKCVDMLLECAQVMKKLQAARNIPPHHLDATTASQAYVFEDLIPKAQWKHLQHKYLLELMQDNSMLQDARKLGRQWKVLVRHPRCLTAAAFCWPPRADVTGLHIGRQSTLRHAQSFSDGQKTPGTGSDDHVGKTLWPVDRDSGAAAMAERAEFVVCRSTRSLTSCCSIGTRKRVARGARSC